MCHSRHLHLYPNKITGYTLLNGSIPSEYPHRLGQWANMYNSNAMGTAIYW